MRFTASVSGEPKGPVRAGDLKLGDFAVFTNGPYEGQVLYREPSRGGFVLPKDPYVWWVSPPLGSIRRLALGESITITRTE